MRRAPYAFVASILSACGPDEPREPSDEAPRVAAAICEAAAACACAADYETVDECEERYVARFEDAIDRGMTADQDCVQAYIDALAQDPCLDEHHDFQCWALRGDRKRSDGCSDHSELPMLPAEECGEGLTCSLGLCRAVDDHSPGPKLNAGDVCSPDFALSCGSLDLYCGSDALCREVSEIDGECEPFGCANGTDAGPLYCENSYAGEIGTCQPIVALGADCDPLDYKPCGNGTDDMFVTCDQESGTCVEGVPPSLCFAMNFPNAWR